MSDSNSSTSSSSSVVGPEQPDSAVTSTKTGTKEENQEEVKMEAVQAPVEHIDGENPLVKCRCGCVPKDMMSLFQMAELRARFREEKKRKETEAAAQNLPQGRM